MASTAATTWLTTSDYLRYRTCPAFCWVAKHLPERIPEEPVDKQRRAHDEALVEAQARELYPDGVLIDVEDPIHATRATEQAIAMGATTLFQASVLSESGLHARADVLTRHSAGDGWTLIDIRSSTSRADIVQRKDVTFQRIAFAEAGYALHHVMVLYLDRAYRPDGRVDPHRLFCVDTSVMAWSEAHRVETRAEIDDALAVIRNGDACPPCGCDRKTRSRRCPTFRTFHPAVPSGDTVFDLVSINQKRLSEVLARGVVRLRDWPTDLALNARQGWQIETVRTGTERVMVEALRTFLGSARGPWYFVDYEAVQLPLPLYQGTRPYQQVPVQYSVHLLDGSGDLHHREFLWTERHASPLVPFAEALRRDIGDEGAILVWWRGFESKRNEELAAAAPHLAEFLLGLNARMVDLMDVVSQGMWVHPAFEGSTSIKKVVPVVAPELTYDALQIGGGALATWRWRQCVVDDAPPDALDRRATFRHLREYCRRDTLALVRIWEHLHHLVGMAPVVADGRLAARR